MASAKKVGIGPESGVYTLAWANKEEATIWHFREAGVTACGAHGGKTSERTGVKWVTRAKFPKDAKVCSTCAKAAKVAKSAPKSEPEPVITASALIAGMLAA